MKKLMLATAIFAATTSAALSHATLTNQSAVQGRSFYTGIRISHGCDQQATIRVSVQIPEGLIGVKPQLKEGWDIELITGDYENTYPYHGREMSSGVKEVIWSGGELPNEFFDVFEIRGTVTDHFAVDETVYLPVVQNCADGSHHWVEIPAEGQTRHDLDKPAPGFTVEQGEHHAH